MVRRQVTPRFEASPANPFCRQLDQAWQARLARRQLYQNEIFLTLVRRPLQGGAGILERLLRKPGEDAALLDRELRQLHATRETFLATLAPYGPRTLSLYRARGGLYSEPAEFLSLLLGGSVRRILAPSGDLGQSLATRRLSFGYDAMEFGQSGAEQASYGAMIGLKDYPLRSMPGMLDGVLRLPFEMVLTESFAYVEQATALSRMNQALRRLRAADHDALSLRSELAEAKDNVAAGRSAYGEHHLSIMVRTPSLERTDQAVAEVQSALAETGAIAVREDMNLEPSFWAQFPGNFSFIARKSLVSTGNFASLASFHNHPTGQEVGNHWGGPIAVLETTAFGPYNFNFHSGDLGNFTVIGPSGSGKTALLAFLLAQAERKTPRIVYFDKDRGAEGFIRAIGGRYDIVSPGVPTGFNPLSLPDTGEHRAFLSEWLAQLLASHGAPVTAADRAMVADAIDANFTQAPAHRRLRYLRELFRGQRRPSAGDLAAGVPMELAGLISAPLRESHSLAADPLSGLQVAYDQLSAAAMHFAHPPKSVVAADLGDQATAGQVLSWAAFALFLASAGLVAVVTLALGVLVATGPLFVALFLFLETRGLFVGWIRALVSCAIGLIGTWTLSVLMLRVIQPWLVALAQSSTVDAANVAITTGAIVIVFSFGQLAVVLAGVLIAQGFNLPGRAFAGGPGPVPAPENPASLEPSRALRLAEQLQRDDVAGYTGNRVVVVTAPSGTDRQPGIAGLADGRLGDLYRRPTVSAKAGRS